MKRLWIFFVLIITIGAELSLDEEWAKFKKEYNKTYPSTEEELHRKSIFLEKLKTIQEHNKKYEQGLVTYTQGINENSDLTHKEFKEKLFGPPGGTFGISTPPPPPPPPLETRTTKSSSVSLSNGGFLSGLLLSLRYFKKKLFDFFFDSY